MSEQSVRTHWKRDRVGSIAHWYWCRTAPAPDPGYSQVIDLFHRDYDAAGSGDAVVRLQETESGLDLIATRPDSTTHYHVDNASHTMVVDRRKRDRRTVYTLNINTGTLTGIDEQPLPGLDPQAVIQVRHHEVPHLFALLPGLPDTVELRSQAEVSQDEIRQQHAAYRAYRADAPDPVLAQVFVTAPGSRQALASLDVIRVNAAGRHADLTGRSPHLALHARRYDGPNSLLREPAGPAALQELAALRAAHPEHSGLAALAISPR